MPKRNGILVTLGPNVRRQREAKQFKRRAKADRSRVLAAKLSANVTRDRLVMRTLRRTGWRVLRVWEPEHARKDQARLVRRIQRVVCG